MAVAKPKKILLPTLPTGELINEIEQKANKGVLSFLKDERVRIGAYEQNNQFKATLGVLFTKIGLLSGLKGEISKIDKDDIYKIVLSRFKELSFDEIYKAFELDRSCQYEQEIEHFGLFNAKYVSKILNEYRKWKSKVRHEHKIHLQEKPVDEEISEEMNMKALEDGVTRLMLYFSENLKVPVGNTHLYKFLRNNGSIKKAEDKERERIIKKAKLSLELENDFAKGVRKAIVTESALMNECKRIQLEEYFEKKLKEINNVS